MTAIDRAEARFFPPQSPDATKKADVEELRLLTVALGEGIERLVPDGRLKAASLTSLEASLMQATRGVFAPVDVSQVQRRAEPAAETPAAVTL